MTNGFWKQEYMRAYYSLLNVSLVSLHWGIANGKNNQPHHHSYAWRLMLKWSDLLYISGNNAKNCERITNTEECWNFAQICWDKSRGRFEKDLPENKNLTNPSKVWRRRVELQKTFKTTQPQYYDRSTTTWDEKQKAIFLEINKGIREICTHEKRWRSAKGAKKHYCTNSSLLGPSTYIIFNKWNAHSFENTCKALKFIK